MLIFIHEKGGIYMIRIAINGYGNLGRGVEIAIQNNPDMHLIGIFSCEQS